MQPHRCVRARAWAQLARQARWRMSSSICPAPIATAAVPWGSPLGFPKQVGVCGQADSPNPPREQQWSPRWGKSSHGGAAWPSNGATLWESAPAIATLINAPKLQLGTVLVPREMSQQPTGSQMKGADKFPNLHAFQASLLGDDAKQKMRAISFQHVRRVNGRYGQF